MHDDLAAEYHLGGVEKAEQRGMAATKDRSDTACRIVQMDFCSNRITWQSI